MEKNESACGDKEDEQTSMQRKFKMLIVENQAKPVSENGCNSWIG